MFKSRSPLGSSLPSISVPEIPQCINTCGLEHTLFRTDPIMASQLASLIMNHNSLVHARYANMTYWGQSNVTTYDSLISDVMREVMYFADENGLQVSLLASGYIYCVNTK